MRAGWCQANLCPVAVLFRLVQSLKLTVSTVARYRSFAVAIPSENSVQHKFHCKKLNIRAYQNKINVRYNLKHVGGRFRKRFGRGAM